MVVAQVDLLQIVAVGIQVGELRVVAHIEFRQLVVTGIQFGEVDEVFDAFQTCDVFAAGVDFLLVAALLLVAFVMCVPLFLIILSNNPVDDPECSFPCRGTACPAACGSLLRGLCGTIVLCAIIADTSPRSPSGHRVAMPCAQACGRPVLRI